MPLGAGAGGALVRLSGRTYEHLSARVHRRAPLALYHSALTVHSGGTRFVIEMTPTWGASHVARGVVVEGPVAVGPARHVHLLRYEIRRWRDGTIVDLDQAVGGPVCVSDDPVLARRVLALVPGLPPTIWGRDKLRTGDMWNSNSVASWLLERAGLDAGAIGPPAGGRAPGWRAGIVAARRP